MEGGIRIGRLWGIPIGLHTSWFLVFALVTWSLATGYFPSDAPSLTGAVALVLAVITSLLFFASVLAHELGHSIVALRNKVPVRAITLFIFGGVAQITREPPTAGAEFRIAVAGPLVSFALAVAFGAIHRIGAGVVEIAEPTLWLSRINLSLAVFNMLPGFPLDGGRVLRALVWRATGSMYRATRVASQSGQMVAFGFIGLGLLTVLGGNTLNGLWLVFIGWFLQNAAAASLSQSTLEHALQGVRVEQVMSRECVSVPAETPLASLVDERILARGQRCFFVASGDHLVGMLTLADVAAVPRERWPQVSAHDAMVPRERLVAVAPDASLLDALRQMDDRDINQVPVVRDGLLAGTLSREQVVHYIRARSELKI